MRIYVFEHDGRHFFVVASSEIQARAVLNTHCRAPVSREAVYIECGMSFMTEPRGDGGSYTTVEVL